MDRLAEPRGLGTEAGDAGSAAIAEAWKALSAFFPGERLGLVPIGDPAGGVYQAVAKDAEWALKKANQPCDTLLLIHDAQEHLAARGLGHKGWCTAPRFVLGPDGRPFVELRSGLYMLYPWIPGRECSCERREDIVLAAQALARFHAASCGFHPTAVVNRIPGWDVRWDEELNRRLSGLIRYMKASRTRQPSGAGPTAIRLPRFEKEYAEACPRFIGLAEAAVLWLASRPEVYRALVGRDRARQMFCHNDYFRRNILITPEGGVAILDLEYFSGGPRALDLAKFISKVARETGWDPVLALHILAEYDDEASRLGIPITSGDLWFILGWLTWPQDFWRLGAQYYDELQPWQAQRFMDLLSKRACTWAHRRRFVGRLASRLGFPDPVEPAMRARKRPSAWRPVRSQWK